MAYSGFLLKVGEWTFPASLIRADTYSAYANMQDVDPWTDADGYLHRNAVDLKAVKIEFETRAMLTGEEFAEMMTNIRRNYINSTEKTCLITAYIPEFDDYVTQKAYLADFTPKIYGVLNGVIRYNPVRLAFIGGVAE